MTDDAAGNKAEIVIVRRRSGDDGAPVKGGAWKIAYADFVTAMMAFFLVMWLINASNEATRSQVASYFNPIKLTDSSTGDRGLTDPKATLKKKPGSAQPEGKQAEDAHGKAQEEALLADPQAALDKVMAVAAGGGPETAAEAGSSKGATTVEQLAPGIGDPFDPKSWEAVPQKQAVEPMEPAAAPAPRATTAEPAEPDPAMTEVPDAPEARNTAPAAAAPVPAPEQATEAAPPAASTPQDHSPDPSKVEAIERDILARLGKTRDELEASLEVKQTPEGILVSLADRHLFGMFRSGSAEPEPKLVELMGAIAAALQGHDGYLVIRGHTDSTPYRGRKYDNWQLSTSRAHMAQYMLIRGGLDESRISRVEGVADRQPRRPDDPAAAENRRIDILLGGKP